MSRLTPPHTILLEGGATLSIAPIDHSTFVPNPSLSLSAARQAERATWQQLARDMIGNNSAQFAYNELGAPYAVGAAQYIGVSHSSTLAAVIVADEPCAIDIESLERNFERVASRYLSCAELSLSADPHFLALAWSIKECVYKYASTAGLSLLDIQITELGDTHFTATITPTNRTVSGVATKIFNHSLAYIS